MNRLKIIVNGDIHTSIQTTNLATVLYLDYCGKFFPNNQWTDLTYPVLCMWTYNLIRYKDSKDIKFELYFMDGPYRMDVHIDSNMQLTIDCINSTKDEIIELTIKCSYCELVSALNNAFNSFNHVLQYNDLNEGRFEPIYRQSLLCRTELKAVISNVTQRDCKSHNKSLGDCTST